MKPDMAGSLADGLTWAIKILEQDARPSFIVDLSKVDEYRVAHMPVVHCNPSLTRLTDLKATILESDDEAVKDPESMGFRYWMTRVVDVDAIGTADNIRTFHGFAWTAVPFQHIFVLVSGLSKELCQESTPERVEIHEHLAHVVDHDKIQTTPQSEFISEDLFLDKTRSNPQSHARDAKRSNKGMLELPTSRNIEFFYNVDWASTSLGPLETWPDELHQMCTLAMSDSEPALLFLGDELVVVHNEAAVQFFPQVQGLFMGSTFANVFPEAWKSFADMFNNVKNEKRTGTLSDMRTLLLRHGRLDECYVSARYMPILDKTGRFLGIYETFKEVTKENVSKRRLATLLEVSTCANSITDKRLYWAPLLQALSTNKEDVGFALLYSLDDSVQDEPSILTRDARSICTLEGTLGVSRAHDMVFESIDLKVDTSGYATGFRCALENDAPVTLLVKDGTLPSECIAGIKCRGYSSECHGAVICPIRPTRGTKIVGFLVIGLSSRVAYDDGFRQFIGILNRQIATSVASVTLLSEEIEREQRRSAEAALVYAKLQERLEQKHQQLLTTEARYQNMTDRMPVGITITDCNGNISYANEAFYTITGHSGAEITAESWIALVLEEDQLKAITMFKELWTSQEHKTFEIRMKKAWVRKVEGAEPISTSTWLLASAYVQNDENGQAVALFSALTDISAQKWAEEVHRRRMVEALELKRQQENFIDTISHEIRNPLSAILQSADEISEYLASKDAATTVRSESLRHGLEAADTIMLCCQHQRRVIDDVLMLSKINSEMLQICPIITNPEGLLHSVIKMFSTEARKQNINLTPIMETSLEPAGGNDLLFDPSRVSQVLVNLIGNAIKFTRDSSERQITVLCGISELQPSSGDYDVEYMEPKLAAKCDNNVSSFTPAKQVYLRFVVQDTGVGMRNDEKKKLFKRFSQASPRTYVRYGGSGLGLFISKQLCELQGGAIGLRMGDGKGTTFAFYVSAQQPLEGRSTSSEASRVPRDVNVPVDVFGMSDIVRAKSLSIQVKSSQPRTQHSLLVVEDNLINQRVMCRQLQGKGYTVYAANHGVEALSFLETTTFWKGKEKTGKHLSLILLDIEMPVMDGLACVRKIRQLEAEGLLSTHIPVVSVSANARHEQIQEARLAGMDDNISKPFQIATLIPKIEALLSSHSHIADAQSRIGDTGNGSSKDANYP